MSNDKLILDSNISFKEIADYFKNLDDDKQVRARELRDGNIQLYARKDSFKQFFTDKLKPDYLVKRDYLNARNKIFEACCNIDDTPKKASIIFHIRKTLDDHSHDFFANEFNRSSEPFLNPKTKPKA